MSISERIQYINTSNIGSIDNKYWCIDCKGVKNKKEKEKESKEKEKEKEKKTLRRERTMDPDDQLGLDKIAQVIQEMSNKMIVEEEEQVVKEEEGVEEQDRREKRL